MARIRHALLLLCLLTLGYAPKAQGLLQKGLAAEAKGLDSLAYGYYLGAADTCSEARLHLGLLLYRGQRYADAAHWLVRADSSSTSLSVLAAARCETSDWKGARQAAEKAIEIASDTAHTDLARAMAAMALSMSAQGNHTGARTWCNKALREAPTLAYAQNTDGVILFRMGKDNEAMSRFREVLRTHPSNIDAHFNLGTIYCYRNNYEQAITTLKKGLRIERHSLKLLYCLGWAYILKGEKRAAITCLENVIAIDSNYINAYNRLGDIYFEQADYNRALDYYRKASKLAPDLAESLQLMGRTYIQMGDYGRATRVLQRAASTDPNNPNTYVRLAELYARQKQPKREQANYKRAAKLGHKQAIEWCIAHGIKY